MLGHLMEWFYSGLAGIRQPDNGVAYRELVIRPELVGDVTWVKASYHCPYGWIRSEWKKTKDMVEVLIDIPANTTATIYLPSVAGATISEVRKNRYSVAGHENGKTIIKTGSGSYHFWIMKALH
jgi:alpha-L-rhamnosidase